jgi:hypothetical protein
MADCGRKTRSLFVKSFTLFLLATVALSVDAYAQKSCWEVNEWRTPVNYTIRSLELDLSRCSDRVNVFETLRLRSFPSSYAQVWIKYEQNQWLIPIPYVTDQTRTEECMPEASHALHHVDVVKFSEKGKSVTVHATGGLTRSHTSCGFSQTGQISLKDYLTINKTFLCQAFKISGVNDEEARAIADSCIGAGVCKDISRNFVENSDEPHVSHESPCALNTGLLEEIHRNAQSAHLRVIILHPEGSAHH